MDDGGIFLSEASTVRRMLNPNPFFIYFLLLLVETFGSSYYVSILM